MPKTKRSYPTGKFFLKYPKDFSNDALYTIFLQYTWNRNVLKKTTEIKCRVMDWNEKGFNQRGELKACYQGDAKRDNNRLQTMLNEMDARMALYAKQHPQGVGTEEFRAILDGAPLTRKDEGKDFIVYATDVMKTELSLNRIGYSVYKNTISALSIFGEFLISKKKNTCGSRSIYIGDISKALVDKYIAWRREVKNNSDATINHALTPIIKAVKRAADEGLLDSRIAAQIADNRIVVKPQSDGEEECDRYLTDEQIKQLIEYYTSCVEPRRKAYLEMFFFSYYACGLRVVDLMTLRWCDIDFKKKEIRKVMIKTSKRHIVPLIEPAISILTKWKDKHKIYVFGLLNDDFKMSDTESLYFRRNTITQNINQSLRVVGESLNLNFPLTMHVARHSFAVHALNNKVDMSVVSRLLGHSSTTVTEKVYAKFLPETLASEVEKLPFDSLL
jgi:integrase